MPGFDEIGRVAGRAVNLYTSHPRIMHAGNTLGIFLGASAAGILAHQSGYHGLEQVLDLANIAATGSYAIHGVNETVVPGFVRDLLRAGIIAGITYGVVGEAKEIQFGYDAPDLIAKINEIPFTRAGDKLARIAASITGVGYVLGRVMSGYSAERANVPHARAHH